LVAFATAARMRTVVRMFGLGQRRTSMRPSGALPVECGERATMLLDPTCRAELRELFHGRCEAVQRYRKTTAWTKLNALTVVTPPADRLRGGPSRSC
jgi:hypothetical protein